MRCGKFYFEDKFNKIKPAYFTESDKHSNYAHHKEKKNCNAIYSRRGHFI